MVKLRTLKSPLITLDTRQGSVLPTAARYDDARRGTTTERGYGWQWQKKCEQIKQRDGYRCRACALRGFLTPGTTVDHIRERADGGDDSDANLQLLCQDCHDEKSAAERARRLAGALPEPDAWCTLPPVCRWAGQAHTHGASVGARGPGGVM